MTGTPCDETDTHYRIDAVVKGVKLFACSLATLRDGEWLDNYVRQRRQKNTYGLYSVVLNR